MLFPSPSLFLSLSICLFAFPVGGKLDVRQSELFFFFRSLHGREKQKIERKEGEGTKPFHSPPIILYSWSTMCFYYLKHSPSARAPSRLIVQPSSEELFPQKQKIALFVKFWLSKMGPQGLDWRDYRIPQAPASCWWIRASSLCFPPP